MAPLLEKLHLTDRDVNFKVADIVSKGTTSNSRRVVCFLVCLFFYSADKLKSGLFLESSSSSCLLHLQ